MILKLVLGWVCISSGLAFLLFGADKLRSGRPGRSRVSEFHLLAIGALGGWPGGLLGMLAFRHKTAKLSFKLKYALAFVIWAVLVYAAATYSRADNLRLMGRIKVKRSSPPEARMVFLQ